MARQRALPEKPALARGMRVRIHPAKCGRAHFVFATTVTTTSISGGCAFTNGHQAFEHGITGVFEQRLDDIPNYYHGHNLLVRYDIPHDKYVLGQYKPDEVEVI